MEMITLIYLLFLSGVCSSLEVPASKSAFDLDLYESVLDEELCEEQLSYLVQNDTGLLLRFFDSGVRIPRGIFDGNLADYGNYYQCLDINQESAVSTIAGKYCQISLPLSQDIQLPSIPELPGWPEGLWPEFPSTSMIGERTLKKLEVSEKFKKNVQIAFGGGVNDRIAEGNALAELTLQLSLCIPKTCTTKQFFDRLLLNITRTGLEYEDLYCRLPNDRPWVPADYVAIVLFSVLGVLVIMSTSYDVYHTKVLATEPKHINKLYQSFSVVNNTRRLVTYTPVAGTIECMDGIRALAMMWVVIGHTFVNQISSGQANPLFVLDWITLWTSLWITMATITVDTFFMLSGLLLVYTSAAKFSRWKLFKNLHMFYLNRLLRMFPVLAAFVLLQSSILNRVMDGPNWQVASQYTETCRMYWWSTLLHVQNWVNPRNICLPHTWYLAIDVQLFIISPLVLFWVLDKKKSVAWIGLVAGMMISVVGSTTYNFLNNFQSGTVIPSRPAEDGSLYLFHYYVNTLPRSPPFFVGMIYGYVLHLYRSKRIYFTQLQVAILWACALALLAVCTYVHYPIIQLDWDNQLVDNLINSFLRPAWALAVGWLVFACAQGYGGPINWFLSHRCWKVLSRLSYATYIVHYTLIFMVNGTSLTPIHFNVTYSLLKFLTDFSLAVITAYILTVLVDSPCSVLIKQFLGGPRSPRHPVPDEIRKQEI